MQARACAPLDKGAKQAELPIKQNSLFPYLSFQEGMLASKLPKTSVDSNPGARSDVQTLLSTTHCERKTREPQDMPMVCTFPLREIKPYII